MAAMRGPRAIRGPLFFVLLPVLLLTTQQLAGGSPPPDPVSCARGTSDCTVTNTYGSFPDRTICRAANATFPSTEQELVAAVAAAAAARRKVKVATIHSHSFPKLACPGDSNDAIISIWWLNRTVCVDAKKPLMTAVRWSSGTLSTRPLRRGSRCLTRPAGYWYGLLATGAR